MAAAIVDDLARPTRLLGAERSKPARIAGRWEFPGGKVDPGETVDEALHRELREELGVTVALGDEIVGPDTDEETQGWFITDRHVMRVWYATIQSGTPEPLVEHSVLRWLERSQLWSVPWLDGDIEIVRQIEGRLK
ncbi:(deoxy)nucleoside triphosphate pyrophosphohydrolase [Rarobacter faecitabidus]|uniref:8-oxo-dGTP diphosphatase n=1 Tax=Rarobacter faecitabidus TaxID=13243 RepID=A0A542ZA82_RARFA|nr:NUDIX domain-containing protein [Rarobacter faecitabidus]TQL57242.1 8-oxo-dGTP diphosphatase [Rarobacter faecitabidus]